MKIHLSKPGGEREGPFTLEEINAGLAQRRFRSTDYWAWYDGLEAWVPLHEIPGVDDAMQAASEPTEATARILAPADEDTSLVPKAQSATENARQTTPAKSQLQSGFPVEALEQIFVFTDGEGAAAMHSPIATTVLEEVIGASLDGIKERVARGVFGRCPIPQQLREEQRVPSSAWGAISAIKPELVKRAHGGGYKVCVRTFDVEAGQKVAVFLFYDKAKLTV